MDQLHSNVDLQQQNDTIKLTEEQFNEFYGDANINYENENDHQGSESS